MTVTYDAPKGMVYVVEAGPMYQSLVSTTALKWNRQRRELEGAATAETLDTLAMFQKLPKDAEEERQRLRKQRMMIEAMRTDTDPKPIVKPPVKVDMFKHQIRGFNMALTVFEANRAGFGLLYEMGLGKTLTSIAIAGAMYQQGKVNRVLVCCPTSITAVWAADLRKFADFPVISAVLQGEKKQRLDRLEQLESSETVAQRWAIINYESTHRAGIKEALEAYNADLIICDESQRIKNHAAAQSKAVQKLGDKAKYKLILSGTPVTNSPVDLYSQYRFADPTVFGSNFYAFRNKYCVMGGYGRHQVVAYRDMEELTRKAHSIALRATKSECLDLPEQTFIDYPVSLTEDERRLYEAVRRDSYTELDNGDTLTAATVITKMLRLSQITGGFLQPDDGGPQKQVNSAKLDALEQIVDDYVLETGEKLVVFARFRAEISAIEKMLQSKGVTYGLITGDTPQSERGAIVDDFQSPSGAKVFLAQIATAGLGITLTAASTTVFYSMGYSFSEYEQATARTHRIGQGQKCSYIHLIVEDTIDKKVLEAIKKKQDLATSIVDNWREVLGG